MRKGVMGMKTIHLTHHDLLDLPASVCAVGYFDGVHRGHVQLIEKAKQLAENQGMQCAVMTFDPDPWTVLKPDARIEHIITLEEKEQLLAALGVDLFYVVEFTREFAGLSIEEFHDLVVRLNIQALVCGFDFTYGKMGKGNVESLRLETRFCAEVINRVDLGQEKISSSRIEELLKQGKVEQANELLGYIWSVAGVIVSGFKRGRKMHFPTANLQVGQQSILPAVGVYAGFVQVDDMVKPAMISVGKNPTFDNVAVSIEAYILGFNGDLYDKRARFYFVNRLRDEVRFASIEDLQKQLVKDEQSVIPALSTQSKLFASTSKLWSLERLDDILNP